MGIKHIIILFFSVFIMRVGFSQLSISVQTGMNTMFSSVGASTAPADVFVTPFNIAPNNYLVNGGYAFKDFHIELDYFNGSAFFSAADKSKNILFFPELSDGRGSVTNSGGNFNLVGIGVGVSKVKSKFLFSASLKPFLAKYKQEFKSGSGFLGSAMNEDSEPLWELIFRETGETVYLNNLWSYGIGLSAEVGYMIFKNTYVVISTRYNQGFSKIMEKTYVTSFKDFFEPDRNALYNHSAFTRGTHWSSTLGIRYKINLNKKD